MIPTPPSPSHQWQLNNHDIDEPFQTSGSPGSEMTHHGIMESGYFDTAATAQDHHSASDWQLRWWTSLMESPPQTAEDDDFLPTMTEHPNYANFYRENPSGYSGQSQPTVPHPQAFESEGFDWDSELVAAAQYYEHAMHHGFFDAPVAATGGDNFGHDSEMPQASGSSQRLGAGHEINSRLSTTRFDPPPRSYRYMPYPTPARSSQLRANPIPTDQADVGVGSFFSPMPTPLVTVAPQAASPAPTIPPASPAPAPAPTIPPAPPAPAPVLTSIVFGPEAVSQVQFDARERMKTEVFKLSFLMTTAASATLARQCLDKTVLNYLNSAEVTEWSKGSKAQAQVAIMTNTVKNLRDSIKDIVRVHVVSGYELQNALILLTQAQTAVIINNLLQHNDFLYGEINVGGRLVRIPFGHPAVRNFVRHLLFHDLNYQRYTNGPPRSIKALLTCTGTLFAWAMNQLSTGIFMDDSFELNAPRQAYHTTLGNLYDSMSQEERLALTADIYTRGGQLT